jgi:hypothetical protein
LDCWNVLLLLQLYKISFQLLNIFIDGLYDHLAKIPSAVGTSWNYFGNSHAQILWHEKKVGIPDSQKKCISGFVMLFFQLLNVTHVHNGE